MSFNGTFKGPDANLEFYQSNEAVGTRQYRVDISGGEQVVSHFIPVERGKVDENDPQQRLKFTDQFTLAENRAANPVGGPKRSLIVNIYTQNAAGVWTTLAEDILSGVLTNPPPPPPQLSYVGGLNTATVIIEKTGIEQDELGWCVHVTTDANYDPDANTPLYEFYQGDNLILPIPDDQPRYVHVAGLDAFGAAQLAWSVLEVTRAVPDDLIQPLVEQLEETRDELQEDVQAVVGGQLLTLVNTLAAHEETIQNSLFTNGIPVNAIGTNVLQRVSEVEASQQQVESILSAQAGNIAAATTQVQTLANDTEAAVQSVNSLVAGVDGRISAVETSASANASNIAAEANTRTALIAALEDDFASSIQAVNTRIDGESARITTQSQQLTSFSNSITSLEEATEQNASAISAETTARTQQVSQVAGNLSTHITNTTTAVDSLTSRASSLETLTSNHGQSIAGHTSQIGTLTTDLSAEVSARTSLASTVGANRSAYDSFVTTTTNNHNAQAQQITGLTTRMGDAESTLSTINLAYTNGTIVTAQTLQTVTARLNSGGDIHASIATNANAIAQIDGRTQAHWSVDATVPGTTASIRANAILTPGQPPVSSVTMIADQIALYNPSTNGPKRAMRVVAGDAEFSGRLTAARVGIGTAGDSWPLQMASRNYTLADGESVTFPVTFDNIPNYIAAKDNLLPRNAGETEDVRLIITQSGATCYAKINVPGTPSNYSEATTYVGNPTYQVDVTNASRGEASNGSYDITFATDFTSSFYSPESTYYEYQADGYSDFGTVWMNVYALKAGSWVLASQEAFYHSASFQGGFIVAGWNSYGSSYTETRGVQLGSGVQAVGISYAYTDGGSGPYAGGGGSASNVAWTAPGTASSTRPALAAGAKTTFTILPR